MEIYSDAANADESIFSCKIFMYTKLNFMIAQIENLGFGFLTKINKINN